MHPVQTVVSDDGIIEFIMSDNQPIHPADWMKDRANSHDDTLAIGPVTDTVKQLVRDILISAQPQWVEVWQYRLFVKLSSDITVPDLRAAEDAVRAVLSGF